MRELVFRIKRPSDGSARRSSRGVLAEVLADVGVAGDLETLLPFAAPTASLTRRSHARRGSEKTSHT
jgi:hypothetical protein